MTHKMNRTLTTLALLLSVGFAAGLAGCGKGGDKPSPLAESKKADRKEAERKAEPTKTEATAKKAGAEGHAEGSALKLSAQDQAAAGIRTARVVPEAIRAELTLSATIQPNRDRFARVAPRVPGRVIAVPAKAGDSVRAGQLLASVDSVEMGESTAAFQQASSQFAVAKADFDRAQRLYDEQVIPQKDFLRARGEHEKSRAALAASADKLRLMGVTPTSGGAASTLPVSSPFAGTVIEKSAVIGDLASPDKPLFTVADLSTVWIEANVNERDLSRIQSGAEALVKVTAYPDEAFKGRVAYVSAVVDRESRSVKARIEVPNGDGRLKPEMFATAVVQGEQRGMALAVPVKAVVLVDNNSTVYVRDADGFEPRVVELGDVLGERQVVKAGLKAGDEVVVEGAFTLKSMQQKSRIGEGH